ncbi:DNA polymerase delta small subunit Cdc1 [Sorochytrium milnesiophthora]
MPASRRPHAAALARSSPPSYMPTSDKRLLLKNRSQFSQQYANIYFSRLNALREATAASAQKKWGKLAGMCKQGSAYYADRVVDVQPKRLCWIVGTVYVDMILKPNILDEISHEASVRQLSKKYGVTVPPPRPKYTSDSDTVQLEDEYGRLRLVGRILRDEGFVTGIVAAVLGSENGHGAFEVTDVCYPYLPALAKTLSPPKSQKRYVALLSGLRFGQPEVDLTAVDLMTDFLTGDGGSLEDQKRSGEIVCVFVAGNTISMPSPSDASRSRNFHDEMAVINHAKTVLNRISAAVPLVLMPGTTDPTTSTLPQAPMHPSMFLDGSPQHMLHSVTNPFACTLDDIHVLGSSGQNVDDIFKYVADDNRLSMACRTLDWRHVAPTAPDTLWCYPFQDGDPFVIEDRPRLYFVGSQPQLQHCMYLDPLDDKGGSSSEKEAEQSGVRVVLVPEFIKHRVVVLVNLDTLDVEPVYFGVDDANEEQTEPGHAEKAVQGQGGAETRAEEAVDDELQGTARSLSMPFDHDSGADSDDE